MQISDLAEKLRVASTIDEAPTILGEYLAVFGIYHFAFTYYSDHIKTGRKLQFDCVSKPLQAWHRHYLEQGYADVDRTLEEGHTQTLPLFWDVKTQLTQSKNIREQRIREESIEYGIDIGLVIPIHGPNKDFASLTLHQCCGEVGLKNYAKDQYEWMIAAQLFYHAIRQRVFAKTESTSHLTKRERECLILTAKSWRIEKIAKELQITPRTVNYHIQHANKKLGVNNKYQAAYMYLDSI
jgi:DNA-binding CsgD family transcriptional regulator